MYCPAIYQHESCVLWETGSHQMVYLWKTQHINHKQKSINLSTKWPWIEDCVVFWYTDQPFENCPVGKSYMFFFFWGVIHILIMHHLTPPAQWKVWLAGKAEKNQQRPRRLETMLTHVRGSHLSFLRAFCSAPSTQRSLPTHKYIITTAPMSSGFISCQKWPGFCIAVWPKSSRHIC